MPDIEFEKRSGHPSVVVAGTDEAGRGCLAGPVAAGAVVLPPVVDLFALPWLRDVTDSKALSPEKRERLEPLIKDWVLCWSVAHATAAEIDRINIHHASQLAMQRAIEGLSASPSHVLVDGKFALAMLRCPSTPVVKGDLRCLSIACASILAKVWRDRLMAELDARYPGYGLAVHKGYPVPAHVRALRSLGPTPEHRMSFGPVSACARMHGIARASGNTAGAGQAD